MTIDPLCPLWRGPCTPPPGDLAVEALALALGAAALWLVLWWWVGLGRRP